MSRLFCSCLLYSTTSAHPPGVQLLEGGVDAGTQSLEPAFRNCSSGHTWKPGSRQKSGMDGSSSRADSIASMGYPPAARPIGPTSHAPVAALIGRDEATRPTSRAGYGIGVALACGSGRCTKPRDCLGLCVSRCVEMRGDGESREEGVIFAPRMTMDQSIVCGTKGWKPQGRRRRVDRNGLAVRARRRQAWDEWNADDSHPIDNRAGLVGDGHDPPNEWRGTVEASGGSGGAVEGGGGTSGEPSQNKNLDPALAALVWWGSCAKNFYQIILSD